MNKKILMMIATMMVGQAVGAAMPEPETMGKKVEYLAESEKMSKAVDSRVDYEIVKNIIAMDGQDEKINALKAELLANEADFEAAMKDEKKKKEVDALKHKVNNAKKVIKHSQVGQLDEYLNQFSFYTMHRMHKKNDQLIKLVRQACAKFGGLTMEAMNGYQSVLADQTINRFLVNLYDVVRGDEKMSKHQSSKQFGMYRTEPHFKGYNKKYYTAYGHVLIDEMPATEGWTATKALLAGGLGAAALGAAYYFSKPISETYTAAEEKYPRLKGARESAQRKYKEASYAVRHGYQRAKIAVGDAASGIRSRATAARRKLFGLNREEQSKKIRGLNRNYEKLEKKADKIRQRENKIAQEAAAIAPGRGSMAYGKMEREKRRMGLSTEVPTSEIRRANYEPLESTGGTGYWE